ncbi:hypothetical protein HU200_020806 [Digitaria exilis]|uniref:Uncharacterized protein n=1 Tax=Digitaria exilis TaxID=1010633 RepID=A0A835F0E9_9POAL|nr:hypothetical protein HU200_020806 [Digitaria exilis]CAB3472362.1 unnamed protein product [Digitaria exilis]
MGEDDSNNKEGTSPAAAAGKMAGPAASWRLNVSDFHMPERPKEPPFVTRVLLRSHGTVNLNLTHALDLLLALSDPTTAAPTMILSSRSITRIVSSMVHAIV